MKLSLYRPGLALLCSFLLMAGCAGSGPPQASIDHMASYDFSDVKTFAYLPRKGGPEAAGVFSDMEIQRMHQAFARALAAKGMVYVEDREQADILASWHLITQEQTDVRSYNASSYYQCWGCGPAVSDVSVRQYTKGTLIFDLVDTEMRKSVWRGVMQSRISDKRQAQGQQERFNAIASAMLESYPPR
jgi:hypothetical protein